MSCACYVLKGDITVTEKFGVGVWRTRDGKKAVVEYRTEADDECYPVCGYMLVSGSKQSHCWTDSGCFSLAGTSNYDLISKWYETPTEILDPATASPELLQQYKEAHAAGMQIEWWPKSGLVGWQILKTPMWSHGYLYRPAGSNLELKPVIQYVDYTPDEAVERYYVNRTPIYRGESRFFMTEFSFANCTLCSADEAMQRVGWQFLRDFTEANGLPCQKLVK